MNEKTFSILAIDGGGIRGIYAATYLAELEEYVGEPIAQYFDLIAGSSTGGIIAIGLGLSLSASSILELYKSKGTEIFSQKFCLGWVLRPKYRNDALIAVLKEVFGERRLGDSCCRLCIPAVDLSTGQTKVYKTDHHKNFVTDWRLPAWKVAAATCAAPIYFPAFSIQEHERDAKVDGGLWANNPSLVGVVEALFLGFAPNQIQLLSIGTGEAPFYKNYTVARKAGLWQWFCHKPTLADLLLSVQSQAVHNQVSLLKLRSYKRINSRLPSNKFGLDDVQSAMDLQTFAQEKAQETKVDIKNTFFGGKASKWTPFRTI